LGPSISVVPLLICGVLSRNPWSFFETFSLPFKTSCREEKRAADESLWRIESGILSIYENTMLQGRGNMDLPEFPRYEKKSIDLR
jgi:hypothetical protein